MEYRGWNGRVVVTERHVIIQRKGLKSFLMQGLKGEKRIPYSSITSVQLKMPGITNGYIQFGVLGGVENRGGVFAAGRDENSVMFVSSQTDQFVHLRDIIESKCGQPHSLIKPFEAVDAYEEIGKFAKLRDQGIISEDEFLFQKQKLLS